MTVPNYSSWNKKKEFMSPQMIETNKWGEKKEISFL